jgi:hypothetical protein
MKEGWGYGLISHGGKALKNLKQEHVSFQTKNCKLCFIEATLSQIPCNMNDLYISPNLGTYDSSISDFFDDSQEAQRHSFAHSEPITLKNFVGSKKRAFIFGEPGYGKSRFFKELFRENEKSNYPCFLIDLKAIRERDIYNFILQALENESNPDNTFQEKNYRSSKNFSPENGILLLDALDEVQIERISGILSQIGLLSKKFPSLSILISCRTHHASRFVNEVKRLKFGFYILRQFTPNQVARYLINFSEELSDNSEIEIINKLENYYSHRGIKYWQSPLNTPRYLEVFCSLLTDKSFTDVLSLSRCELFELFINRKLMEEVKTTKGRQPGFRQKISYIRQCIERLALVMEIQRTNVITKDDLASFEIDANLSISNQVFLDVFYDRTLLKDNIDHLEFENTEFQEYLAAKALRRIGKLEQVIFDVAIEKRLKRSFTSWMEPLSFLVEMETTILQPLVSFGMRHNDYALLHLVNFVNINQLSSKEQGTLFVNLVDFNITNKRWLWNNLSSGLGRMFEPAIHEEWLLQITAGEFDFTTYHTRGMVAEILEAYITIAPENKNKISKQWTLHYLEYLQSDQRYGSVMHRLILSLLTKVSTLRELESIKGFINLKSADIFKGVTQFYIEVAPNSPEAISHFFKVAENNHSVDFGSPFEKIVTKKGFIIFFNLLFQGGNFISLDRNTFGLRGLFTETLVSNLNLIYDDEVEDVLLGAIPHVLGESFYVGNTLLSGIVKIVSDHSGSILEKIVKTIPPLSKKRRDVEYAYGSVLAERVTSEADIETLVLLLNVSNYYRGILKRVLMNVKGIDTDQYFNTYFPEQVKTWQVNRASMDAKNEEAERRLNIRSLKKIYRSGSDLGQSYYISV